MIYWLKPCDVCQYQRGWEKEGERERERGRSSPRRHSVSRGPSDYRGTSLKTKFHNPRTISANATLDQVSGEGEAEIEEDEDAKVPPPPLPVCACVCACVYVHVRVVGGHMCLVLADILREVQVKVAPAWP